ncbi:MAG: CPBP family intramembrane glutamic endopeptidase [Acidimicrobiales bacterium]
MRIRRALREELSCEGFNAASSASRSRLWPLCGLGIWPEQTFFAVGPLAAALIVIAVAEGRAGFRDLGARIIRWRVAWYWYAVAIGFPLAVRFVTAMINVGPGGAPAPEWTELAWTSFAMAFLVRLVNPMDGPLGEEPGWRGFALPRMQARTSPLVSALILGVLVACWHLPLVFADDLGPIGLVSTFSITIVYVWLFNHARGSVLLTLIFHSTQGSITMSDLGFVGADLSRQELLECVAWSVVAIGVIVLDRAAWRIAPPMAIYPDPRLAQSTVDSTGGDAPPLGTGVSR